MTDLQKFQRACRVFLAGLLTSEELRMVGPPARLQSRFARLFPPYL